MRSRRDLIKASATVVAASVANAATPGSTFDHHFWVATLTRVAEPLLQALSQRKLKATMPVETSHGNVADRKQFIYLEALGRLLAGIAPWLEGGSDGAEANQRSKYAELARQSLAAAVDPTSPDFMNFNTGSQPVVDAAFLALAILRAPKELWQKLDKRTQSQLVTALKSSRAIRPGFNNWLLFSATIEAFLCQAGEPWDAMRVDYAVRQHMEWYKGDGMYGDGPSFHWDYYNSFVIHPMLIEVVETVSKKSDAWKPFYPAILARARRYAEIQERLISPEGTFPAFGRSLAYRFGALHVLALMTLRNQLPDNVQPEQVRGALTSVIRRMISAPGTFDERGWLTIGFCGHQPAMGEAYISTGSLYLCSTGLLPLGLPVQDRFWNNPVAPWTSQKVWDGRNVPADHAIAE